MIYSTQEQINALTNREYHAIFGGDTVEYLVWEQQQYLREERIADQDAMEARGGPVFVAPHADEIPW